MNHPAPPTHGSVRARLQRFSALMAGVLVLTTAALLASQLWLQRSMLTLEQSLLPHWQAAQRLHTDARTLSAQAAHLPLSLSQGALDTVRTRVDTHLALLEEDLQRIVVLSGENAESASLEQAIRQLQAAIQRAHQIASQRIALNETSAHGLQAHRAVHSLRRTERNLARLIDDNTVILSSYASALTSDIDRQLALQREQLALQRWTQTLLILLAGLIVGALLMAQSRLLERQLLRRIDALRTTMASGTVDQHLLHGSGHRDELEAMQVELARLLDRLTRQNLILEQLATTDPLTGLANRRRLHEQLEQELARHRRQAQPLSVLTIDIDHFKRINDTWGHAAGDLVLKQLSLALSANSRQYDLVARYGGEEFMVILPATGTHDALPTAEHLRHRVAELGIRLPDGSPVACTISIGIATLDEGESAQQLIDRADLALYRAKRMGRNQVSLAEPATPALTAPHR